MDDIIVVYSHIYINNNGSEVLLYNSIDGDYIIIRNPHVARKFKTLENAEGANYYLDKIDEMPSYVIDNIVNKKFGKVIRSSHTYPVQFAPTMTLNGFSMKLYADGFVDLFIDNKYEKELLYKDYCQQIGKNLLDYFTTLTLYYSTSTKIDIKYAEVNKQYMFPSLGISTSIEQHLLYNFLGEKQNKLERINIIVGDISDTTFDEFAILVRNLREMGGSIFIYSLVENQDLLLKIIKYVDLLHLWVLPESKVELLDKRKSKVVYLGLVASNEEVLVLNDLELFPYKTAFNKKFCMKESGYDMEDVISLKPSQNEIFSSQFFNANFFGELSVLPSGKVYSCMQSKSIGNIKDYKLKELLYSEFLVHKNWFNVRRNIHPCDSCVFNWICPPITNYEIALGETLCNKRDL